MHVYLKKIAFVTLKKKFVHIHSIKMETTQ